MKKTKDVECCSNVVVVFEIARLVLFGLNRLSAAQPTFHCPHTKLLSLTPKVHPLLTIHVLTQVRAQTRPHQAAVPEIRIQNKYS